VFTENLDAFLDSTSGHAHEATYDGATAVKVIFDAAYSPELGVAGTNPIAIGKASVFPAAAVGKTLLVNGVTYTIRNREPQDDGAFVLLQLQAP
jgi:hypothetical protein